MRVLGKRIRQLLLVRAIAMIAFLIIGPGYVEKNRNSIVPHDPFPVLAAAQALHDTLVIAIGTPIACCGSGT